MDPNRRGGTRGEQEVGSVAVGNGLQQAHHTFIHAAGQCTVSDVPSGQVLVVSADERWLRVLEVTLRLGGVDTISRRSAREALSLAGGDAGLSALVLDLAQATGDELDVVRGLLGQSSLPAVVILPERLAAQSEPFAAAGATVLVRPYRPSELYAALRITDSDESPPDEAIPPAAAEPVAAAQTDTPVDTDEE
jgi:DNA-binding response OmpR family regulator